MVTELVGVDDLGRPYVATLDPESGEVDVPADMRMPRKGTAVMSGPAGIELRFDPRDPVAVYVWLVGSTVVVRRRGPDLVPVNDPHPGAIH
jgi:hypothetical protein